MQQMRASVYRHHEPDALDEASPMDLAFGHVRDGQFQQRCLLCCLWQTHWDETEDGLETWSRCSVDDGSGADRTAASGIIP